MTENYLCSVVESLFRWRETAHASSAGNAGSYRFGFVAD